MASRRPYAAVVLAGGAGRRLRGAGKPAIPVAGRRMLDRVLAAVPDATWRVVVGPPDLPLPAGVTRTLEEPPGGGPAAAAAAGLAVLPEAVEELALLAADLPLLTAAAVRGLRRALGPEVDGAVLVDDAGRAQWLCGVWRAAALRTRRDALPELSGVPVRELLAGLPVARVPAGAGPPAWWDCDTEEDLRRAEEWVDERAG